MEIYDKFVKIVDLNLIYCLIPMILTLLFVHYLLKNKFSTKKGLGIVSWIIIIYTLITLLHFIIGIIFYPNEFKFIERATGKYKIVYWIILLLTKIFPLTLLVKKLSSKFWYVLLVAFLMKIGIYFEYFEIVLVNVRRNYAPENSTSDLLNSSIYGISVVFLQGFILAFLILGIFKIMERKKTVHNTV